MLAYCYNPPTSSCSSAIFLNFQGFWIVMPSNSSLGRQNRSPWQKHPNTVHDSYGWALTWCINVPSVWFSRPSLEFSLLFLFAYSLSLSFILPIYYSPSFSGKCTKFSFSPSSIYFCSLHSPFQYLFFPSRSVRPVPHYFHFLFFSSLFIYFLLK